MNKENRYRPSDFELSRYLLNECTERQRQFIKQWIESSDRARGQFNAYKQDLAREESAAAQLPFRMKSVKKRHIIQILFAGANSFRYKRISYAFISAMILIILGSTVYLLKLWPGNSNQTAISVAQVESNKVVTFHDSLQMLLEISNSRTSKDQLPKSAVKYQRIPENGSVKRYSISKTQLAILSSDFFPADQTAIEN